MISELELVPTVVGGGASVEAALTETEQDGAGSPGYSRLVLPRGAQRPSSLVLLSDACCAATHEVLHLESGQDA